MASGDHRDINSFLEEKKLPKGAIAAIVKYGLETDQDFLCMTEEEFDNLEAKDFEKERLKKVWRKLKGQTAPAAPQVAAQTVMHGGQGNMGTVNNPGHIEHVGHTYNQGPVGPGTRQQNNYDSATDNVQTGNVGTFALGKAAMDEDLRKLLEDKGLMADTVAALQRQGVNTREDLMRMTSDMVDRLPLSEQVAEVQKATLKSLLEELKAGPSSIKTVVRNNRLCVENAGSNTHSGFLHRGEGACAQNITVENSETSVGTLDEGGSAVTVNLTADKSDRHSPWSGRQGNPEEVVYQGNALEMKTTGDRNVQEGMWMQPVGDVTLDCKNNTQVMENTDSNNMQTGVHLSGGQGRVAVQSAGNQQIMRNTGDASRNLQIGLRGAEPSGGGEGNRQEMQCSGNARHNIQAGSINKVTRRQDGGSK